MKAGSDALWLPRAARPLDRTQALCEDWVLPYSSYHQTSG